MRPAAHPTALLQAVQQAGQRRALMTKAVMQVVDRAGSDFTESGEHMRLRLSQAEISECTLDPERQRMRSALKRWDKMYGRRLIHTISYYTMAYYSCQGC